MNHDDVVIVAAARTPQGRLKGQLAPLTAVQLGSAAIRGALEKGGIPADAVDAVLVGQVLAAGSGQNPARQAAVGAGIPWEVHSGSVNKVCLSGLTAIIDGARMIGVGDAKVVVAAGMESMTRSPAPADGLARRLGVRLDRGARPHGVRRPHRRLRPREHGRVDRAAQRAVRDHAARHRMPWPPVRTSGPPRRRRTACSTPRSCRSRSRSARATRSS